MLFKTRPKNNRVRKALTFLGLIVINLPNGVLWYAGNLTTYTSSYFVAKFGPDTFTGSVTLTASYFFMLTIGIIGFHKGCCMAVVYDYILLWTTGDDVGFATGLTSQLWLGAVLINQLITLYINPENVGADLVMSKTKYFSQPEILDRTPSVFLVLGAIFLTVHLFGFSLLMEPIPESHESSHAIDDSALHLVEIKNIDKGRLTAYQAFEENLVENGSCCGNPVTLTEPSEHEKDERTAMSGTTPDVIKTESSGSSRTRPSTVNSGCVPENGNLGARPESEPKFKHGNISSLKMLRHKEFYLISYLFGCTEYGSNIVAISYKAFGQNWITDDHFMAILGTTVTVCLIPTRVLLGILYDKFGTKRPLVFQLALTTVLATSYFWTPRLNRWLFFIWTCCLSASVMGMYGFLTVALYKYFGDCNYASKVGLASLFCLILNLATPSLFQTILEYLGWFWVFCSTGIGFLGALLLSIRILSENM